MSKAITPNKNYITYFNLSLLASSHTQPIIEKTQYFFIFLIADFNYFAVLEAVGNEKADLPDENERRSLFFRFMNGT